MNHGWLKRRGSQFAVAATATAAGLVAAAPAQAQVRDRPPNVVITAPAIGTTLPSDRPTTLSAEAGDDRGITRVTFQSGSRLLCTVTAPPFNCAFQPTARDVGFSTLIVKAFDAQGATATDFRDVEVANFKPRSVSIRVRPARRDRRRPYRFRVSGRLALPAGVTPQEVCFGGSVLVTARGGGTTSNEFVGINRDCSYRTSILTQRGRLKLNASFRGNRFVEAATSRTKRVRAG